MFSIKTNHSAGDLFLGLWSVPQCLAYSRCSVNAGDKDGIGYIQVGSVFLLYYLGHIHELTYAALSDLSCGCQCLNKKTSYLILSAFISLSLK